VRNSRQENLRLHLGCGNKHYKGMLNCDIVKSKAVDVVMDCGDLTRFNNNSARLIFAHSFFEHLCLLAKQKYLVAQESRLLLNFNPEHACTLSNATGSKEMWRVH